MEALIQTFLNPEIIAASWPIVLAGLRNTVLLSLLVVPLGLLGGLMLALLASVKNPLVRWPLMAWVDFFRAFPPLVLLILLFAGLPFAGLELGGFVCVAIAFFLNTGAYYGEILRAGIDSVPSGQLEAARSTGLSRLQHARGSEADRARQRGRGARIALSGATGAEHHLQPHAHRGGGADLLRAAVAGGAAAEPPGEPRAGRALALSEGRRPPSPGPLPSRGRGIAIGSLGVRAG
jgi:His/Glu/Gln/Arg/opine family amino acid ABC transporter permease subunit